MRRRRGDEVADEAQLLGGVEDGLGRKRREGAYVVLGARRRAASDQTRGPQHPRGRARCRLRGGSIIDHGVVHATLS